MPKLTCKPPKYSHHVPSGQARVRYRKKDYYLGVHGSPESYQRYSEFLARLNAGELAGKPKPSPGPALPRVISVAELIERFWDHCKVYYRRDGKPTGEQVTFRSALRPLLRKFGATPAGEFTPKRIKEVREAMIDLKWSRRYINASVRRIRFLFNWAVEEELVTAAVAGALATVKGIREGRTAAREKPEVGPVADEVVEATLPRVSPVAADVIRLMRLSGARPAEAVGMKVEEIDRTDPDCWRYRPRRHKTYHRGKKRVVFLGPKCQEVLSRYILKAGSSGKVFPITHSGLRTAITRGCRRAGVEHWAPNQLRHTHATTVRRDFGVEASQVMLGHSHINTTEIYAEADAERGREVARKMG
jgi:integrase